MKKYALLISYLLCITVYALLLVGIGWLAGDGHIGRGIFQILIFLTPFSVLIALFTMKGRTPNWFPFSIFFWGILPTYIAKSLEEKLPEPRKPVYNIEPDESQQRMLARDEASHRSFPIDWEDVTFKDGAVEMILKKRKMIVRYICNSKSIYSMYKSALEEQFRQLEVEAKDGKYCLKNPEVLEESILIIIKHLEVVEKERRERIATIVNGNPEILDSLKNQTTIILSIKAQKSDYINHLFEHQAEEISIIKTSECCSYATSNTHYYEKAYVFAIRNRNGRYCVIYENENEDKASIVSTIYGEEKCYACAVAMINHMKSSTKNKRETLHKTHDISGFTVNCVKHDDIAAWKSRVTGDYYVPKTSVYRYGRKHRHRRWYRRW